MMFEPSQGGGVANRGGVLEHNGIRRGGVSIIGITKVAGGTRGELWMIFSGVAGFMVRFGILGS